MRGGPSRNLSQVTGDRVNHQLFRGTKGIRETEQRRHFESDGTQDQRFAGVRRGFAQLFRLIACNSVACQ